MFLDFIYNISLLVACCAVYALVPHQRLRQMTAENAVRFSLVTGSVFGVLGMIVMSRALEMTPGLIFDARSIVLCVAGAVFGPLAVAVAACMCAAYRLWLGGPGVVMGLSVIAESAILSALYYRWRQRNPRLAGYLPLYALGMIVHAVMLVLTIGIPSGMRTDVLRSIWLPVLVLYPLGVVLLCRIFLGLRERADDRAALETAERNYRELVELSSSLIVRWKPDGTIVFVNEPVVQYCGSSREELLGKNIVGTIVPAHLLRGKTLQSMLQKVIATPAGVGPDEQELVRKDGSTAWLSWSARVLFDSAGAVREVLSVGIDITGRKQAELELEKSERQYRLIVETVNEGIWSVDCSFCTTFVNRRLCEMLGYDAEYMLGRSIGDFMPPEDVRTHDSPGAACRGRESGLYERRLVRRDGSIVWTLVSVSPFFDADGGFAGSLATLTDITRQKQAVLQIQQSEEKFHRLFENMSQGVFYQSADGSLVDINPAGLEMLGLGREEFLCRTSFAPEWHVVDEDEAPIAPQDHPSMRALKTGSPVRDRIIGIMHAKTGQYVWLAVNAIPLFSGGAYMPSSVFVTMHDITEAREAQSELRTHEQRVSNLLADAQRSRRVLLSIMEDDRLSHEALRESEERFRSVVETATDAIITIDANGSIVVWNRAASQIFGYEYGEIIGKSFTMLMPEELQAQNVASIVTAIESGVLPSPLNITEAVGRKRDGTEFPAEIACSAVKHDGKTFITAIVRDITERKLIEQEALRSAQLVSIGELAAGVAHEINNPIMGVINYAQIMLNSIARQGGTTDIPERIIKEGTRIAAIVSNLLNFSRSGSENAAPVTVGEVFDQSFQLVQKLFQQSEAGVEVHMDEQLPMVLVRSQKIQQVFINLLSNALYALNDRFPDADPDKRLVVSAEELHDTEGDFVRVVFHDYGCGIAPEHLARICNPFFTTKPAGKGTGLGLSICHTIVKEHRGRLLFESEAGQYTRVVIDLPAQQREDAENRA